MGGKTDEIVIEAFSARFLRAYGRVAAFEGGFSNDPIDRGGATNHGISLRFLLAEGKIDLDEDGIADFDLDMDGDIDVADIRKLQPIDAQILFQRCFWNRLGCGDYPAPLGEAMFDQGVNGGLGAARKLLQRAINSASAACLASKPSPLSVDGDIGEATRERLARILNTPCCGMPLLIECYREEAADRYRAIVARIPSQAKYLKGWLRRAESLGAA
ncbi:MAG: hypothetical protein EOP62_14260 [Sphingomonadales bacterium]|nr:MAG: hypothetical protein EOP62_14260 [Sphingomonadales bacterium]